MAVSTNRRRMMLAALIFLCLVPTVAGMARLAMLAKGAGITAENARFFDAPLPVVVHIVAVTLFCVGGAFQFFGTWKEKFPRWHGLLGKFLLPAGLAASLSGLWMAEFYYFTHHQQDEYLYIARMIVGSVMTIALVLAYVRIRQRNIAAHRDWMVRGYAIGMGAGTQVLTTIPWVIAAGEPGDPARSILLIAGWVINIIFAEWIIRRRRPTRRAPAELINASRG